MSSPFQCQILKEWNFLCCLKPTCQPSINDLHDQVWIPHALWWHTMLTLLTLQNVIKSIHYDKLQTVSHKAYEHLVQYNLGTVLFHWHGNQFNTYGKMGKIVQTQSRLWIENSFVYNQQEDNVCLHFNELISLIIIISLRIMPESHPYSYELYYNEKLKLNRPDMEKVYYSCQLVLTF